MIKFKRIILIILLLFTVTFISCSNGNHGNDINNSKNDNIISFYQFRRFKFKDTEYEISKPKDALFIDQFNKSNNVIKYYYHEYQRLDDANSNLSTWTINYKQEIEKVLANSYDNKDLIYKFYEEIESSILEYSVLFNNNLDYYKNYQEFEKEFIVDMNENFSSVLIIDLYLPYKLVNYSTKEETILNVPIKSFLAYKIDDVIKVIDNDFTVELDYNDFISSSYLYK